MTCVELVEQLIDFYDDVLDDTSKNTLERHLDECPDCLHFSRTYEATVRLARDSYSLTLPPEAEERIAQVLRREFAKTA